jgi:hypothetical protein
MTWPSQSPDLNPIEMVRDELYRRVMEKQPTNTQRIWELLQYCWKSIPGDAMKATCCTLYNHCDYYYLTLWVIYEGLIILAM